MIDHLEDISLAQNKAVIKATYSELLVDNISTVSIKAILNA